MAEKFFAKILQEAASLKFQLAYISCFLFYQDKLSEAGWLTAILSIAGFRMVTDLPYLIKNTKSTAETVTTNVLNLSNPTDGTKNVKSTVKIGHKTSKQGNK